MLLRDLAQQLHNDQGRSAVLFVHTAELSTKQNLQVYIPLRAGPTCDLQDRQPFGSPLSGSKSEKFAFK